MPLGETAHATLPSSSTLHPRTRLPTLNSRTVAHFVPLSIHIARVCLRRNARVCVCVYIYTHALPPASPSLSSVLRPPPPPPPSAFPRFPTSFPFSTTSLSHLPPVLSSLPHSSPTPPPLNHWLLHYLLLAMQLTPYGKTTLTPLPSILPPPLSLPDTTVHPLFLSLSASLRILRSWLWPRLVSLHMHRILLSIAWCASVERLGFGSRSWKL